MKIIIPTLGRMDKQVTYNNLPDKYKKDVLFIVQAHEADEMGKRYGEQVVGLPSHINRIAPTRQWIYENFKEYRHFVMDDDLNFIHKKPNKEGETPKWLSRKFTEDDFDNAFNQVKQWMDGGYVFGGFATSWVIPSITTWPKCENQRIMTNVFYDGPNLPDNIEWDRVTAAEDFDVTLQLLTQGYKNIQSSEYTVGCSETNAEGGCSEWRTLEVHNKSQLELAKLWPQFVKVREKQVPSGPWKGETKLATTIQWAKAYKSSQKEKPNTTLSNFF